MDERFAVKLAVGSWILTMALVAVSAVLTFLSLDAEVVVWGWRGFEFGIAVPFATVGTVVAARRPENPIGWLLAVAGFLSGLQGFGAAYATYSVSQQAGTLPGTIVFAWFQNWIWVGTVGIIAIFVFALFPDGSAATRPRRFAVWYGAAAISVFAAGMAVFTEPLQAVPPGLENPYGVEGALSEAVNAIGGMLFVTAIGLGVGLMVARFRRSVGDEREQMKWLVYAGSVVLAGMAGYLGLFIGGLDFDRYAAVERVLAIVIALGAASVVGATGIAILKYRLYDIDIVINKTIVFAVVAASITVVYVGIVVGIGSVLGGVGNVGLSIAATAVVAVAFQPLRARANRIANRLVFGERASPYEALSAFASRLSEGYGTDETLPRLASLITEATAADRASVWLTVGAELRPAGAAPEGQQLEPVPLDGDGADLPGWDRVYPVRHEGELLGALAVSARASDPLTPPQEQLLADLGAQAGLLLRNARLIAELRASRQRLVAAQDAERRRIERDLHDGAQQQLVALSVNLGLVQRVLGENVPPQASQLLDQLKSDASDALENLRDTARGIYPPLLAERGLVSALQAQAQKAALPVSVEGDGVARYSQEVESAIYFCVLEALQNVAKYAQASRASVRVGAQDGRLHFEVADDGAGFDARAARRGAGLTNMADRLDALGGALEVRSTPGAGTTIAGWIAAAPS